MIFSVFNILNKIQSFFSSHVDENGEVFGLEELKQLEIEKETLVEELAKEYINQTSLAEQIKVQKQVLENRQATALKNADKIKQHIQLLLSGKKFDSPSVSIKWRKTKKVNVLDELKIEERFLKQAKPTVDKTSIKKAIENGEIVVGAELVQYMSMSIR